MKSELPKCLHEVCGMPMVEMAAEALRQGGVSEIVVVVGHGGDLTKERLGDGYRYALQEEQNGTGHAVLCAAEAFAGYQGSILVTAGDVPLLKSETVEALIDLQQSARAGASMATFVLEDPTGYGRIIRDQHGRVSAIREHKDCSPEQREINEVNPGVYCFDAETLFRILPTLSANNAQGEIYLTDVIAAIRAEGGVVEARQFADHSQFIGINDRWQLAEAAQIGRMRILRRHAEAGVTIVDPHSTYIEGPVSIEPDVIIQPMTVIEGRTSIGAGSEIGPNSWVKDSTIGRNVRAFMSHLDQATMNDGSRCGPFANLRPHTELGESVKVGNFVEIKNSKIGSKTSISHLTYIGDATVGERSNIGAGTITCNYDGFKKHRTEIGSEAFIGSNSTLVAPVKIGDGAMTAAGSVITKDMPDHSLGIGRARQDNKEEWAKRWRELKKSES